MFFRPYRCGNYESVVIEQPRAQMYSIGINANCRFDNVTLQVSLVRPTTMDPSVKYRWKYDPFPECPVCTTEAITFTRKVVCEARGSAWFKEGGLESDTVCTARQSHCTGVMPPTTYQCPVGCQVDTLELDKAVEISGDQWSWRFFRILVDKNSSLSIYLAGGEGDGDLYLLSAGQQERPELPTVEKFTWRSTAAGNEDSISVLLEPGVYYLGVHGFKSYQGIRLTLRKKRAFWWRKIMHTHPTNPACTKIRRDLATCFPRATAMGATTFPLLYIQL